jgi:hypothetical protein
MTLARLIAILGLAAAALAIRAEAYEDNYWPAYVAQKNPGDDRTSSWEGAGPFLFSGPTPGPDAGTARGFRPFYVRITEGGSVRTDILYPLFFYRKYPDSYKWSVLNLINGEGIDASVAKTGGPTDKHFDVWPFYFSHETKESVDTYHALLPIYGTIKYRLGFDRLSWVLFPLYVQTLKKGRTSTYVPWPFVKVVRGSENGFGLWPLFGATKGPGPVRHSFFLWPLGWDNVLEPKPSEPEDAPLRKEFGFIPFYTRETAQGFVSVNYGWPFFGYTDQTLPHRYVEKRYFWPFAVQGKGDDRLVDRWGPFYTHSNVDGADSTWVLWPLWHQKKWADDDIAQTKTQFYYFLYWSLYQRSVSRPWIAPAYKRHIWPLFSVWDNGAGSRQLQVLSPIEVFFPSNPDMREVWAPLFSVYRYDHRPTGETRTSLLWNAVTWRRNPTEGLVEFHLGPLFGMHKAPSGASLTILGFDFGGKQGEYSAANR